ncbi:hypothetical protein OIU76_019402 [Salix suchowensis]|nr:hypothetical protein OIU76_019402 [Salix suchowensis]
MASKATSLGSSLLVPCVQELAKDPLVAVPPRYIRYDQEHPIIASHDPVPEVPVIDMQRLLDQETMDSELGHLHLACKTWGFFQVNLVNPLSFLVFFFLYRNLTRVVKIVVVFMNDQTFFWAIR